VHELDFKLIKEAGLHLAEAAKQLHQ
jgi:hypothetical protein